MDIVETNIGPSVTEAFFETLKRLEKSKNRFHYCGDRLRTLRTELKTKYMQDDILPELDLVSEAASTLSMFTLESQVSIGSSRSKPWSTASLLLGSHRQPGERRKDKKKTKIREGDPQEEAFLLKELRSLMPTTSLLSEVTALLRALISLDMMDMAACLQRHLVWFLEEVSTQERNPVIKSMKPKKGISNEWPDCLYSTCSQSRVTDLETGQLTEVFSTWLVKFLQKWPSDKDKSFLEEQSSDLLFA